jgi:hypothetical protein
MPLNGMNASVVFELKGMERTEETQAMIKHLRYLQIGM